MKRYIFILAATILLSLSVGCQALHINGKNSKAVAIASDKIQQVEDAQSKLNATKIQDMTVLALGTDYALGKETNASKPVLVAKEINQRVISEGGYSPTIEEIKGLHQMIDGLVISNQAGILALQIKDAQIQGLQSEEKYLVEQKNSEIQRFQNLAEATAQKADDSLNELSKYQSYWGLGAIALGAKSLFLHLLWASIIFIVIFIVLRALSLTNPFAAAIFGIFQSFGAAMIHLIETCIPSSIATLNEAKTDVKVVSDAIDATVVAPSVNPSPSAPSSGSMTPASK